MISQQKTAAAAPNLNVRRETDISAHAQSAHCLQIIYLLIIINFDFIAIFFSRNRHPKKTCELFIHDEKSVLHTPLPSLHRLFRSQSIYTFRLELISVSFNTRWKPEKLTCEQRIRFVVFVGSGFIE